MSENLSARERKAAMKKPVKIGRRQSSPVTVSYLPVTRRVKRRPAPEAEAVVRDIPKEVRFVELRPKEVHPWDWHQLYIEDEELWPFVIEEATDAVESGELKRYDRIR